jgi:hypothetical protein
MRFTNRCTSVYGALPVLPVVFAACHIRPQAPSAAPSAQDVGVSVLPLSTGTDCPTRLRGFRNCVLAADGFALALESITPVPPARLAFGQPIVARLRYSSRVDGVRIQVQPSNSDGCAAYDWNVEGAVARVPSGVGTVERSFTIRTAAVRTCGPGQRPIRVKNGEVFVERIRLLVAPTADRATRVVYDQ